MSAGSLKPAAPLAAAQYQRRDLEQRRRLVAGITQAVVDAYAVPADHLQVFIHEVGHEHCAKGCRLAADPSSRKPRQGAYRGERRPPVHGQRPEPQLLARVVDDHARTLEQPVARLGERHVDLDQLAADLDPEAQ